MCIFQLTPRAKIFVCSAKVKKLQGDMDFFLRISGRIPILNSFGIHEKNIPRISRWFEIIAQIALRPVVSEIISFKVFVSLSILQILSTFLWISFYEVLIKFHYGILLEFIKRIFLEFRNHMKLMIWNYCPIRSKTCSFWNK